MASESVDCSIATEFFEQCPDAAGVMREVFRVLKPSGFLAFSVPFLWPIHDAPLDQYRYTPFALDRLLRQAGFSQVEMNSLGGWDASLAQMTALWLRRRPMSQITRSVLSTVATPVIRLMFRNDRTQPVFTDQAMITGIAGIAFK
jgi:SAM-dependent methyltransferase